MPFLGVRFSAWSRWCFGCGVGQETDVGDVARRATCPFFARVALQQERFVRWRARVNFFAAAKKSNQKKTAFPTDLQLAIGHGAGDRHTRHPWLGWRRRASCAPPFGSSDPQWLSGIVEPTALVSDAIHLMDRTVRNRSQVWLGFGFGSRRPPWLRLWLDELRGGLPAAGAVLLLLLLLLLLSLSPSLLLSNSPDHTRP